MVNFDAGTLINGDPNSFDHLRSHGSDAKESVFFRRPRVHVIEKRGVKRLLEQESTIGAIGLNSHAGREHICIRKGEGSGGRFLVERDHQMSRGREPRGSHRAVAVDRVVIRVDRVRHRDAVTRDEFGADALADVDREKAQVGTVLSYLMPYAMFLLVGWSIMLVVWYLLGLPVGPDSPILLPAAR